MSDMIKKIMKQNQIQKYENIIDQYRTQIRQAKKIIEYSKSKMWDNLTKEIQDIYKNNFYYYVQQAYKIQKNNPQISYENYDQILNKK